MSIEVTCFCKYLRCVQIRDVHTKLPSLILIILIHVRLYAHDYGTFKVYVFLYTFINKNKANRQVHELS